MLAQLSGSPLPFFVALLPIILALTFLLRNATPGGRVMVSLQTMALVVLLLAVAGHLYFAFAYLLSPNFSDHIEPNAASVAWMWANGGQIYHAVDAAERYAFLYGPLAYISTGIIYLLFGASTLTAKLAGILCLLATLGILAITIRRRFPGQFFTLIAGLGYFSLLALFFKNFSFWSKPDSFMIAASALGLFACSVGRLRLAWVVCGIAIGLAANAKITGVIYFLPYVAWMYERDGIRAPFAAGMAALLVMILPYLAEDSVSLSNYIAWLQAAGGHGLSRSMFMQNLMFMIFMLLPLIFFLARRRGLLYDYRYTASASVLALGLVLVAASKPGSGPHHFLPFLPALGFMAAMAVWDCYEEKGQALYVFWAPVSAFLLAAALKSFMALYYGLPVVSAQYAANEYVAELETIATAYPDSNIYMGYGDGSTYTTTFVRNHLVYDGNPLLVDASAIMDFQFSGIDIPQLTIDRMLADKSGVWLIPASQEPFTLVSWYLRNRGGLTFDENFRAAFVENFVRIDGTTHYDVYMQPNTDLEEVPR